MQVKLEAGETLWEALRKENIFIDRPCGGKGTCGMCQVELEGQGQVLACQFKEPGTYQVRLAEEEVPYQVLNLDQDLEEMTGLVNSHRSIAAVDIGTTTVAAVIFDKGRVQAKSFINPQRQYGADVLSRIQASNQGAGQALSNSIRDLLDKGLGDCQYVISANTTMGHLYRGLSCQGLGQAPFTPVDISLYKDDRVTLLPGISAFVGGDIVSGLYYLDLIKEEKPVLFLDLGTNGEMALGCRDKLLVASAAAGPAFEGNPVAMKLHASGIISALAQMKEKEIIDQYGTLCQEYFEEGYQVSGQVITQDFIRDIQMAKAAIRAGIEILMKDYGIKPKDISKVYLAGGMGYFIDAKAAVEIGLLPEGLKPELIRAVGNTSLKGAVKYLVQGEGIASWQMDEIIRLAEQVVLAEDENFQDLYIENMNL